jgi:transcriptional regulator with XRE-family HTH domain
MTLPHDLSDRIHAGERPLKVWREHRGLEVTDLRRATRISVGRLEQLETGKGKNRDEEEERLLARALDLPRACLRPMSFAGCSDLDVDEDEILARDQDA